MPERRFGPYTLVHLIAVGGMAEIHLARAQGIAGFEKYVALKMIHPNFSSDQQFVQMLIDEAKITVQLQHVNIAQTFDLGRVDQTYYITMEFVDGADLYKLMRKSAETERDVPIPVAAYVAKEVATGLDYAHRKRDHGGRPLGIVHRDVSPQNVLISHAGEVKLVDFGIAKATMRARQTQVGVIKGKYYYMSPEQANAGMVDHRTDVFSTGILLYEMLTGQMLYLEEDLHRLLDMVRRADIAPPTTLRRDVPPELERITMRALEKRPEDRYRSAGDMAGDLERFLHGSTPVFTATRVSQWMNELLGAPSPPAAQTGPSVIGDKVAHTRDEFIDEHSVIRDGPAPPAGDETFDGYEPESERGRRAAAPRADSRPRSEPRLAPPRRAEDATRTTPPPERDVRGPRRAEDATRAVGEVHRSPSGTSSRRPVVSSADERDVVHSTGGRPDTGDLDDNTVISAAPGFDPPPLRRAGEHTRVNPLGDTHGLPDEDPDELPEDDPFRRALDEAETGVVPPPARGAPLAPPARPAVLGVAPPRQAGSATLGAAAATVRRTSAAPPAQPTPRPGGLSPAGVQRPRALDPAEPSTIKQPFDPSEPSTVKRPAGTSRRIAPGPGPRASAMGRDPAPRAASPRPTHPGSRVALAPPGGEAYDTLIGEATEVGTPLAVDGAREETTTSSTGTWDESETVGYGPAIDGETSVITRPSHPLEELDSSTRNREGWEKVPAAAARVPRPAVSELRPPRPSRRTPVAGVGPGEQTEASTISQILAGERGEPQIALRPPTGDVGIADTRPALPPAPPPRPETRTPPEAPRPPLELYPPPPAPPPGYSSPPPAMSLPPAPHARMPDDPPELTTVHRSNHSDPAPLAEAVYHQARPRRGTVAIIALVAMFLAGAVGTALFRYYGTGAEQVQQATVIEIVSSPPGATVTIDGDPHPERTPTRFTGAAGKRYVVALELARHQRWESEVGNESKVIAVLRPVEVKLTVTSEPAGADVFINGAPAGRTPLEVGGLDPLSRTVVEVRKKGLRPHRQVLEWGERELEKTIEFELGE